MFARKPTSSGGLGIVCSADDTSTKRSLAILEAGTTSHGVDDSI